MLGANAKGALLALAGFAIFATHDVIVKVLGAHYSPIQIVFFSVLLGFPLVLLMLIRDSSGGSLRARHPWWSAFRTVAVIITGFSAFYAFSVLPLAQTYAILFATPLLITILSIPLLGETVRLRRWLAVIAGLIGVMVVLRPGQSELGTGHLAALAAAVGSAFASIIVRKIGHEERSLVLLLYPMIGNVVVMGAALPLVYRPMPIEHLGGLALIAGFAVLATLCIIGAYKKGEAVVVAPMQYSQILWATLFGYLFFDETLDLPTAVGAAIIIASGLYILFREGSGSVSENRPVLRTRSRPETGTTLRIGALMRRGQSRD
ncbi:DMT family transporter [Actibacterium lipolyticum]|uniref:EamA-like transporter family protein n=1 Tax=Actibacterium lipolyticum TaxID=1524263 RepID=A0A238KVD6_9RHOB|nr:DMT family transporter [Actibacterium lipolyticum]SMX46571.1 EamA-like transporter family protein [Actibacterium lipolyticum]